jgi:hypothetical protein
MSGRQIDHARPHPQLPRFPGYVSTQDPGKNAPVVVLYWDTLIRGKALIDPFIYEHASWGDLELRVAVFKVNGSETIGAHYSWQRIGDEEEELEVWAAWVSLAESRAPEVEKFLGECWGTVEQRPNSPFRAAFDRRHPAPATSAPATCLNQEHWDSVGLP